MTKPEAMAKLEKILALTASPSEGEAAAAMAMAEKLRAEFDISTEDYIVEEEEKGFKVYGANHNLTKYQKILLGQVSHLYGCLATTKKRKGELVRVIFIGEKLDVYFAKEMYSYLVDTVYRAGVNYHRDFPEKSRAQLNDFRNGMAYGISQKMDLMGQNCSWAPERPSKLEAANDYLKNRNPDVKNGRLNLTMRGSTFTDGIMAGEDVGLNRQACASEQILLA
jgi:hypothetical protein